MKINGINVNKEIYSKICEICPSLKKFFEQGYLDLFKEYFDNKDKKYEFHGKIIVLSKKTKTFNDLLNKKINKNNKCKERFKYIANNYFLKSHKKKKKILFRTKIK